MVGGANRPGSSSWAGWTALSPRIIGFSGRQRGLTLHSEFVRLSWELFVSYPSGMKGLGAMRVKRIICYRCSQQIHPPTFLWLGIDKDSSLSLGTREGTTADRGQRQGNQ